MSTILVPHEQQGSGSYQVFNPIDQEGVVNAVCVDALDLGLVKDDYNPAGIERIEFAFELDRVDPQTHARFVVKSKRFPKKLNANPKYESGLHKFLVSWRGRGFADTDFQTPGTYTVNTPGADGVSAPQERQGSGFELESMIGKQAQLQVVNKVSAKGRTYTVINAIMPRTDGKALEIEGNTYVRPQAVKAAPKSEDDITDTDLGIDDIPF